MSGASLVTSTGRNPHPEEERIAEIVAIVRELAAELHPGMPDLARFGPDASIERDFGLDSLARVELAVRLERAFGLTIPDAALAESETVREIARALVQLRGRWAPPSFVELRAPAAPPMAPDQARIGTLLDALEWHVQSQPDRTHVNFIDEEAGSPMSFRELRDAAVSVAAELARRGVRPGEPVGIMLPTGKEFFAAFYGALYARAVPVPIYPPARSSQVESHLRRIAGILANCGARILLTFERARRLAHLLPAAGARIQHVLALPGARGAAPAWTVPPLEAGDTAFLQYTSGSTGQPKGVVLTHANLLANLRAMQAVTAVGNKDCFVSWLPLYHDMGLIGACFGALVLGFPLILMSPFTFLSHPLRWLQAIDRHDATLTAAPNFAFELCLGKIDDEQLAGLDLGSLRMAFNGAEAVSARTLERFAARFGRHGLRAEALMPVYGLAENSLGLTFPPMNRVPRIDRIGRERFLGSGIAHAAAPEDPAALSVVSCGMPLPGHSVRIVDAAGGVAPERTQGRIEFRGPSATSGYYGNPEETAHLFHGAWLDTGDLGYLAEGELYVTGRAKDIIIRGGQHIHPQELEAAVAELPGVRKGGVAVFPASDPQSGTERLIVLAELRDWQGAARPDLVAGINRLAIDLTGFPVDEVVLAPPRTILKTSSGKLRHAACREAFEHGRLGSGARASRVTGLTLQLNAAYLAAERAARRACAIAWGLRAQLVLGCLAPLVWLVAVLVPGLRRRRRSGTAIVRLALRLGGLSPSIQQGSPVHGNCVYVANHASYLDAALLLAALPHDVTFVAKREFLDRPLLGRFLRRIDCVFVERFERQEAAVGAHELDERLRAGESLVVFPEGTFHRAPGLLPFHMGAFSAAAGAGVPVLPVAIRGSRALLPEGSPLPRPGPVEIVLGEPLVPGGTGWRDAVALRSAARRHILAETGEPDLERLPHPQEP